MSNQPPSPWPVHRRRNVEDEESSDEEREVGPRRGQRNVPPPPPAVAKPVPEIRDNPPQSPPQEEQEQEEEEEEVVAVERTFKDCENLIWKELIADPNDPRVNVKNFIHCAARRLLNTEGISPAEAIKDVWDTQSFNAFSLFIESTQGKLLMSRWKEFNHNTKDVNDLIRDLERDVRDDSARIEFTRQCLSEGSRKLLEASICGEEGFLTWETIKSKLLQSLSIRAPPQVFLEVLCAFKYHPFYAPYSFIDRFDALCNSCNKVDPVDKRNQLIVSLSQTSFGKKDMSNVPMEEIKSQLKTKYGHEPVGSVLKRNIYPEINYADPKSWLRLVIQNVKDIETVIANNTRIYKAMETSYDPNPIVLKKKKKDAINHSTGMENIRCFRCKELGHYAKHCPRGKHSKPRYQPYKKDEDDDHDHDQDRKHNFNQKKFNGYSRTITTGNREHTNKYPSRTTNTRNVRVHRTIFDVNLNNALPRVTIQMNGHIKLMELDTCSAINVLSIDEVKRMGLAMRNTNYRIKTVAGIVDALGETEVTIHLDRETSFKCNFVVVPQEKVIILGIGQMRDLKSNISLVDNEWSGWVNDRWFQIALIGTDVESTTVADLKPNVKPNVNNKWLLVNKLELQKESLESIIERCTNLLEESKDLLSQCRGSCEGEDQAVLVSVVNKAEVQEDSQKADLVDDSPELVQKRAQLLKELKEEFPIATSPIKGLPPSRPEFDVRINLKNTEPPRPKMYPIPEAMIPELEKQISEYLEKGLIKPSITPFAAPVLFVPKPNNKWRLCVDYRQLNGLVNKDVYTLPRVDSLLYKALKAKLFSKIDLLQGYHQLRIFEDDTYKTGFRTTIGTYEYLVVPFGFTNAPAAFQRFIDTIFKLQIMEDKLAAYLDDLLITTQ